MKKPVSLSVTVLQQFGCLVESEEDKEIKIFLLFNTLQSLYNVPAKQNIKIRRNPETRLVLHALCFEEKTAEKVFKIFNYVLFGLKSFLALSCMDFKFYC